MWKNRRGLGKLLPALALAVVLVGLSGGVSRADCLQGQPIYVQNNTGRTIWVAAHYIPPGSSSYVTDGFWKVAPGQRMLILYNNGVWAYFYARDDQGRDVGGGRGAPIQRTVRGETGNFYPENTGTDYNPRVLTFYKR